MKYDFKMQDSGSIRNPVRSKYDNHRFRVRVFDTFRKILGGHREPRLIEALENAIKATKLSNLKVLDFGTGSMFVVSELHRRGVIDSYCGIDTYPIDELPDEEVGENRAYIQIETPEDLLKLTHFNLSIASDALHHVNWHDIPIVLDHLGTITKFIVVKDCFEHGFITRQLLRLSDWFGNSAYDVNIPERYFTPSYWESLLMDLGMKEVHRWSNVKIHNGIFGILLPSRCHFVSIVCKYNKVSESLDC